MLSRLQAVQPRSGGVPVPRSLAMLPVCLNSFGYEVREAERYRWEGMDRGSSETVLLQYCISGCGGLRYGDRHLEVRPGQLMLLHWPHDHCYYLPDGGRWEFIYAIAVGASGMRLLRGVERDVGPLLDLGHEHPAAQALMGLVVDGIDGRLNDPIIASERLYGVVARLLAHVRDQAAEQPRADAVLLAQRYARERLHLAIGVDDMARAAGLSRAHFSRLFRSVAGDTPAAWLQSQRLQRAMDLLMEDRAMSLEAVAISCGFGTANYFGKVFRKAFGTSPGAFRCAR